MKKGTVNSKIVRMLQAACIFTILSGTTTAQAREFLTGKINLSVSHTSLQLGTQVLVDIENIDVHVSDDGAFCQATTGGKTYPCFYQSEQYSSRPAIFLRASVITAILTAEGIPNNILNNLNGKMKKFRFNDIENKYETDSLISMAPTRPVQTVDLEIMTNGRQVHDDVNPDAFHIKSNVTERLTKF